MDHQQQWSQPPQYPQQWPAAPHPAPAPRKPNLLLLLVLAPLVIVLLVVVGLVGFYVVKDIARGGLDGRGGSREATSFSSFDVVCDRGSISNAAQFGKPYKIAAFGPDDRRMPLTQQSSDPWTQLTLDPGADYAAAASDFRSVNVVACLSHKPGTAVKTRDCTVETKAGEQVTFGYYAVQYSIELREARTGKHLDQLPAVDGPAQSCPFLLWVNTHERKMYAQPDLAAIGAELAEYSRR